MDRIFDVHLNAVCVEMARFVEEDCMIGEVVLDEEEDDCLQRNVAVHVVLVSDMNSTEALRNSVHHMTVENMAATMIGTVASLGRTNCTVYHGHNTKEIITAIQQIKSHKLTFWLLLL